MKSSYIKLVLKDVDVTVRVGIAAWESEQQTPPTLLVNVEPITKSQKYLRDVTPTLMIDFSSIYHRIRRWRSLPHADLIENIVGELFAMSFKYPRVSACIVSVAEAEVLAQARSVGAEACINRRDYFASIGSRYRLPRDGLGRFLPAAHVTAR